MVLFRVEWTSLGLRAQETLHMNEYLTGSESRYDQLHQGFQFTNPSNKTVNKCKQ